MAKYWGNPNFSPKMTQNGLKWILNTTLYNFCNILTSGVPKMGKNYFQKNTLIGLHT